MSAFRARARCLAATLAGALGVVLASPVIAQCSPAPGPLIANTPVEAGYVARYNALIARDPYQTATGTASDWRALLDDLDRDRAVSVALVARAANRLAAALGQDDDKGELPIARRALALAETNGLATTPLHAEILAELSFAETDAGNVADAVGHADAAMAEAKIAFGPRSWPVARAARAATSAYNAAGRYADGEPFAGLAEELAIACLPADDPRIVGRMTSHAAMLGMAGRLDDSLAADERAVGWALAHGQDRGSGMLAALDGLGWDFRNRGRFREADAVLRRGVDLAARYHPREWEVRAGLLGKFADVLEIEGHHEEAEALWAQASALDRNVNSLSNPLIGSGEIRRAASAAQARGDLPLALARREQAVALIAKHAPPNHPELARARIEQATSLSIAGRGAEARAIADPAMATLRTVMAPGNFLRMAAEVSYARIVAGTADAATAYPLAEPVAQRMETMLLDSATSSGDLIRLASLFTASFAITTKLALYTHRDEEAFHRIQLVNFSDLVLVNTDMAARAAAANPAARDAVARLQREVQDRQQADRDRTRAVAAHDAARLARLDAALHDADAAITATTRELDRVYPTFRRIGRPAPVALAAFRSRLGADDVLIAPFAVAGEALTIAVTREGMSWASTPMQTSRLRSLIARIRSSIDASRGGGRGRFDVEAARQLYLALLPSPLAPVLRTHRHILYYASGILARIPPALLVERAPQRGATRAWLIRSHSVSVLPTLDPIRVASVTARGFLGIGAPLLHGKPPRVFERGSSVDLGEFGASAATLPPLPRAAHELRAMAASFPAGDGRLLLGAEATEHAIKTLALDRVGTIAIATHGLVRDALPGLTEPALVLTPPKTPDAADDGLLTASEIANLRLDADWVILSACDTAGGSSADDASYTGLARAFIEAGARALLVSHWAVRDDAAERLTVATVRAARRGTDRATALQRAMLALMRDRSVPGSANPAVWAPFVLIE